MIWCLYIKIKLYCVVCAYFTSRFCVDVCTETFVFACACGGQQKSLGVVPQSPLTLLLNEENHTESIYMIDLRSPCL